ncbi:MAG: hypothetical protein M5R40_16555 [Anaerolineae bacterium]|nr:hypothetical protein [Anaerolineae bacterium]
MTSARFTLSAFADEVGRDFDAQLALLRALRVGHIDFRSAWGVNVRTWMTASSRRQRPCSRSTA